MQLRLGIFAVSAIDLVTDSVVRAFLQDVVKLGGMAKDVEDFILRKPALRVPITMECAHLIGTNVDLRYAQLPKRDVIWD